MMKKTVLALVAFIVCAVSVFLIIRWPKQIPMTAANPFLEFRIALDIPAEGFVEKNVSEEIHSFGKLFLASTPALTGQDLEGVGKTVDAEGKPRIVIALTEKGSQRLARATTDVPYNLRDHTYLTMMFDGSVYYAPQLRSMEKTSSLEISGNLTQEEIDDYFAAFTSPKLPVRGIISEHGVSGGSRLVVFENFRRAVFHKDDTFRILTEEEAFLPTDEGYEIVSFDDPRFVEYHGASIVGPAGEKSPKKELAELKAAGNPESAETTPDTSVGGFEFLAPDE